MYSCLSIQKYYPNLHLVTDDYGITIFKEALELPYVSFSNALNALNDYPEGAWALGKLYTYQIQTEPFCHIDGDVFLFGPALDSILGAGVFCQSFDHNMQQYSEIHPYVHKHFRKVPDEFKLEASAQLKLINAGVIGGNNLDLFQLYTTRAFELVDNNHDKIVDINGGIFNLYYEQFLLSNIISQNNLEVATLYEAADDKNIDFAAFHTLGHSNQYVHLISHLKMATTYMEQVVVRLQLEFPNYFDRLVAFQKGNKV